MQHCSARPECAQSFRRDGLRFLELGRRQTGRQKSEDGMGDFFGINGWIAMHAIMDTFQKDLAAPYWAPFWMAAFIVKSAQERREIGSQIDRLLEGQAIAQRMQCGKQGQVHSVPVLPSEAPHQVAEPFLGCGNRSIEIFETGHRQYLAAVHWERTR